MKIPLMLLLGCSALQADPINYQLALTVEGISPPVFTEAVTTNFGTNNSIGDTHLGTFTIDDSLLKLEGDNLTGTISNFVIQIGTVIWDQNQPSDFSGFRGPGGFAPAPGFNVHDGQLTGLTGGVFGFGDAPFIDFFGNSFSAVDARQAQLTGELNVHQVPEPSTLFLFAVGLFIGAVCSLWRKP